MNNFEFAQSVPEQTTLDISNVKYAKHLWLDMIKKAKKSIDIGQFYIHSISGEAMEPVLKLISDKANKGVKVRMVVDKNMAESNYEESYFQGVKNIEIRKIDLSKLTNSIMHAKYMIIDKNDTFIGSQNFDWRSLTQVHEIGFRIQDKDFAESILEVFEIDWEIAKTGNKPQIENKRLRSPEYRCYYDNEEITIRPAFSPAVITPAKFSTELEEVLNLINNAEKSIYVSVMEYSLKSSYTGYYLTDIDFALRKAAVRGVSVKLLFTNWATKEPSISFIKSLSSMPNIEVKISSIPRLKERFIPFARVSHCKFMVVDNDKAWIGTTNWEPDYFLGSRNMSIVIQGKKPNLKLRELFFNSWTQDYSEYVDVSKKYIPPQISD